MKSKNKISLSKYVYQVTCSSQLMEAVKIIVYFIAKEKRNFKKYCRNLYS